MIEASQLDSKTTELRSFPKAVMIHLWSKPYLTNTCSCADHHNLPRMMKSCHHAVYNCRLSHRYNTHNLISSWPAAEMRSHDLLLGALAVAAPGVSGIASCTSHIINVKASASNHALFAPNLDLTSVSGIESLLSSGAGLLGQLLGFLPVSGTYEIAAKYCPPAPGSPASRAKEVQLLLHGVPYNSVSSRLRQAFILSIVQTAEEIHRATGLAFLAILAGQKFTAGSTTPRRKDTQFWPMTILEQEHRKKPIPSQRSSSRCSKPFSTRSLPDCVRAS